MWTCAHWAQQPPFISPSLRPLICAMGAVTVPSGRGAGRSEWEAVVAERALSQLGSQLYPQAQVGTESLQSHPAVTAFGEIRNRIWRSESLTPASTRTRSRHPSPSPSPLGPSPSLSACPSWRLSTPCPPSRSLSVVPSLCGPTPVCRVSRCLRSCQPLPFLPAERGCQPERHKAAAGAVLGGHALGCAPAAPNSSQTPGESRSVRGGR